VEWSSEQNVLVRQLIIIRRETTYHYMEATIYIMRMLMLISSLQVRGHSYLNPIFVSACGLCQAFANVFKAMNAKKKFYKLSVEDV
jgi:hypothetical protein